MPWLQAPSACFLVVCFWMLGFLLFSQDRGSRPASGAFHPANCYNVICFSKDFAPVWFLRQSHGLQFSILLPRPPVCWGCKNTSPHTVYNSFMGWLIVCASIFFTVLCLDPWGPLIFICLFFCLFCVLLLALMSEYLQLRETRGMSPLLLFSEKEKERKRKDWTWQISPGTSPGPGDFFARKL